MFEIPFASELTNMVNFITLDLVLLPYVMHVSGLLAGYANHSTLSKARELRLVVFDIPLVGGGIVMSRCWLRTFFIIVRLSVVAAVAVCNFGLEGRSRAELVTREATVRVPGVLNDSFNTIYMATERRMRCSDSTENGDFKFGAVMDDRCYLEGTDDVYISKLAFDSTNITASATSCESHVRCSDLATTFHCDRVDLVCSGTSKDSGCEVAAGVQFRSCVSVVYDPSDASGWICLEGWLMPGIASERALCRQFWARRQDVQDWVKLYLSVTADPLVALFGSAYGQEARRNVTVPDGEKSLTIVQAIWIVPMIWVVIVAVVLTIWLFWCRVTGAHVIAHDERGLTKLLNKQIEESMSDFDDFELPQDIFMEKTQTWLPYVKDEDQSTSTVSVV